MRNVSTKPSAPIAIRIRPTVWISMPLTCVSTANARIAPTASRNRLKLMPMRTPPLTWRGYPRRPPRKRSPGDGEAEHLAELVQRHAGIRDLDRRHPQCPRRLEVHAEVVEEDRLVGL